MLFANQCHSHLHLPDTGAIIPFPALAAPDR